MTQTRVYMNETWYKLLHCKYYVLITTRTAYNLSLAVIYSILYYMYSFNGNTKFHTWS